MGCYRCEYHGNLEKLFRGLNKGALTLEAARLVMGQIRTPKASDLVKEVTAILRGEEVDVRSLKPVGLPSDHHRLTGMNVNANTRTAFRYLEKRGATAEMIEAFDIGYAWSGRYAMRLFFPIKRGGKVVYWTTRYCGDHQIKSLNPDFEDGFLSKEEVLLNYDACVGRRRIALAEGPFSAMGFHDPALDCPALATLGKSPSVTQLKMIEELVHYGLEELVIAYDPDAAAKIESTKNALSGRVPLVTVLKLVQGDPWDRRADLPELLAGRGQLSLSERVRGRFTRSK